MKQNPKRTNIKSYRDHASDSVSYNLPEQIDGHWNRILKVTVVLPLHNEAENIKKVSLEIKDVLIEAGYQPSILLVDDGSTDASLEVVARLSAANPEISYISFSRNFGKETAILAGMHEASDRFDVLAYMDSDGQHDPADLIKMLKVAESPGTDLVCGARIDRHYQTKSQRWLTKGFYKLFSILTGMRIENGVGDFNVLRPKVVNALRSLNEEQPFMKGLVAWVGFNQQVVPIKIRPRAGGMAKSSTKKMLKLAVGAFLSFSSWPLRAWSVVGFFSAFISLLYLTSVVFKTIVFGADIPGYATTIVLLLGLGGLQLFSIGILGEYIARIYEASKNRPRYIIKQRDHRQIIQPSRESQENLPSTSDAAS
jgi:glycosyltransferase involved in cell wall biosynthesis